MIKLTCMTALFCILVVSFESPAVHSATQQDESDEIQKQIANLWLSVEKSIDKSDYKDADKQLSKIIELAPNLSSAYYHRGRVRFQAGNFKGSVSDFDKHVKLSPNLKSRQWERGISLYYARDFEGGAKQFEIYQTYHDNDVENSAWRFLCVAQTKGIKAARKNLLPIRNDRRIPMMQIYAMYQGKMTPEKVLEAAETLPKTERQKNSARFYANLYVGLLYEVQAKTQLAEKHIELASQHKIDHYMWNVADVHLKQIRKRSGSKAEKSKKQ